MGVFYVIIMTLTVFIFIFFALRLNSSRKLPTIKEKATFALFGLRRISKTRLARIKMLTSRTLQSCVCSSSSSQVTSIAQAGNGIGSVNIETRMTTRKKEKTSNGFHSTSKADSTDLFTHTHDKTLAAVHCVPLLSSSLADSHSSTNRTEFVETGKNSQSHKNHCHSKKQSQESTTKLVNGGYVKRLAAKNATACVNAMFESTHKKRKYHEFHSDSPLSHPKNTDILVRENPSQSGESGCLGKRRDIENDVVHGGFLNKRKKLVPELQQQSEEHVLKHTLAKNSMLECPSSPTLSSNSISSDESDLDSIDSSSTTPCGQVEKELIEYSDAAPYNVLGILYNSDCIYFSTRFFLPSESSFTKKIMPTVVPSCKENIFSLKESSMLAESMESTKQRSHKGDNGWVPIGNPIKTISINFGKGKKVQRKYYIGIKRKQEAIFSRDSILLRSGSRKDDVPFVAKIASIWQEESGGLMMTVFWYYRKEDTDNISSSQFVEMEVMASQHHDDISVACIDDKCYVLGFTEFCRFKATVERMPLVKTARQSQSNSKLKQRLTQIGSINSHYELLLQSEVYLCFRAYNHITGKIINVTSIFN